MAERKIHIATGNRTHCGIVGLDGLRVFIGCGDPRKNKDACRRCLKRRKGRKGK